MSETKLSTFPKMYISVGFDCLYFQVYTMRFNKSKTTISFIENHMVYKHNHKHLKIRDSENQSVLLRTRTPIKEILPTP